MSERPPRIFPAVRRFWIDLANQKGSLAAISGVLGKLWEFLRDSTPSRRRQRFGDADYDWDCRVNTTSGSVSWRDRLLGVFHSPYQPTEPTLFHEMMSSLLQAANINLAEFTFIDLGSGKGRTLLMASDYPFRRIVGVELLPALHAVARENLAQYSRDSQKCFALEPICADAATFPIPAGPLVVYLFNPFPESVLCQVVANLESSLRDNPRPAYVLYHNPQLEQVFTDRSMWIKSTCTHQYSILSPSPGVSRSAG